MSVVETKESKAKAKVEQLIRSTTMYSAPYSFDSVFERALVALLCASHEAYGKIGDRLVASAFSCPAAVLLMETCQTWKGGGPGGAVLVIQNLRNQLTNGKIKRQDLLDAADYLEQGMDAFEQLNETLIIEQAVTILADRLRRAAASLAVSSLQEPEMVDAAIAAVKEAQLLGSAKVSVVASDTDDCSDIVNGDGEIPPVARWYVPGFDEAVPTGGYVAGDLITFLAGTSDGKGVALCQSVVAGYVEDGMNEDVAYLTLEDPRDSVFLRIMQNLYGVVGLERDVRVLLKDIWAHHQTERERLNYRGNILVPEQFMPIITKPQDLINWVNATEQRTGRRIGNVAIDYADKLTMGGKNDRSKYVDADEVYETLRIWATTSQRRVFTASQATRRTKEKKGKVLDTDDTSDSMGKARVTDVMISLNADKESNQYRLHVAKWRKSTRGQTIGPFPHGFNCGRIHEMTVYPRFRLFAQRNNAPTGIQKPRQEGAAE